MGIRTHVFRLSAKGFSNYTGGNSSCFVCFLTGILLLLIYVSVSQNVSQIETMANIVIYKHVWAGLD